MKTLNDSAGFNHKAWRDTADECKDICANLRAYNEKRNTLARQLSAQADDFRRSLERQYRDADAKSKVLVASEEE